MLEVTYFKKDEKRRAIFAFLKIGEDIKKGTYVSIWKKNKEGVWKYVLDACNEGLGDKK